MPNQSRMHGKPISPESLADLNEELSAMIDAGIPLDQGLRNAARFLKRDSKRLVERLITCVEQGATLEEAIDRESETVPPAYLSLIRSGLRMGRLSEALKAYTSFARSRMDLRREVGSALLYPVFVFVMAFALSLFVSFFIFPQIQKMLSQFQLNSTPLMEYFSRFFNFYQNWYLLIPAIFGIVVIAWKVRQYSFLSAQNQTETIFKKWLSAIAYGWIPGYHKLIREMNYSTFAEMSGLLLTYQVPLHESFILAAEATGNKTMIAEAQSVSSILEKGGTLEAGIHSCKQFPGYMKMMVCKTGYQNHLPKIMSEIARVYRMRVLKRIDWIKRIFPVAALVLVAGGVSTCYTLFVFLPFVEILKMLGSPSV